MVGTLSWRDSLSQFGMFGHDAELAQTFASRCCSEHVDDLLLLSLINAVCTIKAVSWQNALSEFGTLGMGMPVSWQRWSTLTAPQRYRLL